MKNAVVVSKEIDIPACVHDVVGGLYFMRTLNLEPGQSAQVPVSDGKKSVMAKIEAQAREDVKTPAGTFKTMRYEIYLFNGVLYGRSAHLLLWLTDDRRRLPVQVRVAHADHHRHADAAARKAGISVPIADTPGIARAVFSIVCAWPAACSRTRP